MITITINDEKEDGSKSIWTVELKSKNIDAPKFLMHFAKMCAHCGYETIIRPLKLKGK